MMRLGNLEFRLIKSFPFLDVPTKCNVGSVLGQQGPRTETWRESRKGEYPKSDFMLVQFRGFSPSVEFSIGKFDTWSLIYKNERS